MQKYLIFIIKNILTIITNYNLSQENDSEQSYVCIKIKTKIEKLANNEIIRKT
jgi:hypothetical protein